jgi:hypothetical protein
VNKRRHRNGYCLARSIIESRVYDDPEDFFKVLGYNVCQNFPLNVVGYTAKHHKGYTTFIYPPSIQDQTYLIVDTIGLCEGDIPEYLEELIEYTSDFMPEVEFMDVSLMEGFSFDPADRN